MKRLQKQSSVYFSLSLFLLLTSLTSHRTISTFRCLFFLHLTQYINFIFSQQLISNLCFKNVWKDKLFLQLPYPRNIISTELAFGNFVKQNLIEMAFLLHC
jgi:hypothetical protein